MKFINTQHQHRQSVTSILQQHFSLSFPHSGLHIIKPDSNLGVLSRVLPSLAALDGRENSECCQISQVGTGASVKLCAFLTEVLHPVVALVVQRLPYVIFHVVALLQSLTETPHHEGTEVDDEISLPGGEYLLPATNLVKPLESSQSLCRTPVDVGTEAVDQFVIHPLPPLSLLHDVFLGSLNLGLVEHEEISVLDLRFLHPVVQILDGGIAVHDVLQTGLAGVHQQRVESRHDHRAVVHLNCLVSNLNHHDGNFLVLGPLDLGPHDAVHLHHVVAKAEIVQECPGLAAEWTGLILEESYLHVLTRSGRNDPSWLKLGRRILQQILLQTIFVADGIHLFTGLVFLIFPQRSQHNSPNNSRAKYFLFPQFSFVLLLLLLLLLTLVFIICSRSTERSGGYQGPSLNPRNIAWRNLDWSRNNPLQLH